MIYIHIPVDFQKPTDRDFEQFRSVMEQLKDVPVHVHCVANCRISACFYRYRRDVLGGTSNRLAPRWRRSGIPKGV
jgi:protein tyrosine phosphatase (PTP) superfamily phosphohydrolase (DUF442 family)